MELFDLEKILVLLAILLALALWSGYRQNRRKTAQQPAVRQEADAKRLQELDTAPFDLPVQQGYARYPMETAVQQEPLPDTFLAVEIALANEQPYSIALLAISEYKKMRLQKRQYYYVRPPKIRITRKHSEVTAAHLQSAYTLEELWNQGLKEYMTGKPIVSYHGNQTAGALLHAFAVYGIPAPKLSFISVAPLIKDTYKLKSYSFASVCREFDISADETDISSCTQAVAALLQQALADRDDSTVPIHHVVSA